jgi:GntR family transcriptional regulator
MKTPPETKIERLAAELRCRIEAGDFVVGQRLPSVQELAATYGVNPATVRSALFRLQAENVIQVLPRSGTFVRARAVPVTIGPSRPLAGPDEPIFPHFFPEARTQAGSGPMPRDRWLVPAETIQVVEELARRIGIRPETEMIRSSCVRLVDGIPYALVERYQMAARGATSSEEDPSLSYERKYACFTGRLPSAEEAALLHLASNQVILEQELWTWDASGVFQDYRRVVTNAALHQFGFGYDVATDHTRLPVLLHPSLFMEL